ncbi:MAG: hypothetical protein LAO56_23670 [Acidobacteriia bacterium]|nr:hypothetical protein [Terriglobia bacterium]
MMTQLKRLFTGITILAVIFTSHLGDAQKSKAAASTTTAAAATPAATSSSNAPLEVEMLSYGAIDKVMEKIAVYACNTAPTGSAYRGIVVLDTPALQALQAYDGFGVNAKALADAFSAMQGTAGAGSGIDTFADITNAVVAAATASTSETSFSFTIQDPTAAIVMLHHLQSQKSPACKTAAYAGVYGVNEAAPPQLHGTPINSISAQLSSLATLRVGALQAITAAGQSAAGAATRNAAGCAPIPTQAPTNNFYPVSAQDPCFAAFSNLDNSYNTFLQGLSGTNAATNQPLLSSILQGYHLRAALASGTTTNPLLGIYVNISAAGGTQQIRKNLLTAVFTGDWIRYSGGASVNVIIFRIANGTTVQTDQSAILYSDLVRYRTPLSHIKKPAQYDNAPEAGDNLNSVP